MLCCCGGGIQLDPDPRVPGVLVRTRGRVQVLAMPYVRQCCRRVCPCRRDWGPGGEEPVSGHARWRSDSCRDPRHRYQCVRVTVYQKGNKLTVDSAGMDEPGESRIRTRTVRKRPSAERTREPATWTQHSRRTSSVMARERPLVTLWKSRL